MEKKEKKESTTVVSRYTEGIGRRKTAVARVRVTKGTGGMVVNSLDAARYFSSEHARQRALSPLSSTGLSDVFHVSAHVVGGGLRAQADAVRMGLARALVTLQPDLKKKLRHLGFLTRDSRMVERKKYGLKKARRAPQWSKR